MRIFPLGDSALTIEFGNEISLDLNSRAVSLARKLAESPFAGMTEVVPAYASVTVFFDPAETNFSMVERALKSAAESVESFESESSALIEIPMIVSSETSPDLKRVSEFAGLRADDVLEIFALHEGASFAIN